jgi:tRNA threonylcarbamoyladenosine biosynthesis protein TsaB
MTTSHDASAGPLLAVATSTEWCSVALLREGEAGDVCDCISERAGNEHSKRVLAMASELLEEAGLALPEVAGIAFDAGPGSFTGLRIGCGVAQGLGFALQVPVHAVGALEALALQAGAPFVLAAVDARMQEVYVSALELRGQEPSHASPLRVLPLGQAALELELALQAHGAGRRAVAIGDAFDRHPSLALRFAALGVTSVPGAFPRADAVARIAAARRRAGARPAARDAAPIYVRDKVALDVDEQRLAREARSAPAAGAVRPVAGAVVRPLAGTGGYER